MSISVVAAVTDLRWFDRLRADPDLEEVNFWSPSPVPFKALSPGELFLFKLKSPRNKIGGGGIFTHASVLPCSVAWQVFRHKNGAGSEIELRKMTAKYRSDGSSGSADFKIGCRILWHPFFLEERDWFDAPNFAANIVKFKRYSTDDRDGRLLWDRIGERLPRQRLAHHGFPEGRFGAPQLVRPRLGQGAFRVKITDLYDRKCAVTSERTLPALEAAHIKPYAEGGKHSLNNGLLLRRDIHSLFDYGYVTVTKDLHFEVSPRIRDEFENGREYYGLHGKKIVTPQRPEARPSPDFLDWHNTNCFR